jgi:hypothetical protein
MSNLNTFDCQVRSGNNNQHIVGSFITPNDNNNIVSGLVSAINNMNPSNADRIYSGQIPFMALSDNLPTNNTNPYARNLPIHSQMASLISNTNPHSAPPVQTNPVPFNLVNGFVSGINNTNPYDARNLPYGPTTPQIHSEMVSLLSGIRPEGTLPPKTNPVPFNNNLVNGFVSNTNPYNAGSPIQLASFNNANPADMQPPKTNIENYGNNNYGNNYYGNYNNLSFCWKSQKKYTL